MRDKVDMRCKEAIQEEIRYAEVFKYHQIISVEFIYIFIGNP